MRIALAIACGFFSLGCHGLKPTVPDRECVSSNVSERFGASIGCAPEPDKIIVPPGLALGEPLCEDHAVLLALWNNPAFQELLVDLQLTRSDLIQANLLPNPEVLYYFSAPDKPFRYLVDFPVESLWLRPIRVKNAKWENARSVERLTQAALDLIRDTRQAYADVLLARDRVAVAERGLKVRGRIAELAENRLKAGDASVQEAATGKIDSLLAKQDATRIGFEIALAEERLKNLTGLAGMTQKLILDETPPPKDVPIDGESLVLQAVRERPDAIAADLATFAARERLRLAKIGWVRFLGILDATAGRNTGHEFGPGFRVTLPIFNWNQGGIARAEAELEQLERRRRTVHNQIILDVKLAAVRYDQAKSEIDVLRNSVRPEVEASIIRAEKSKLAGNAAVLLELEATRQLLDTLNREAQLKADLRRAWADLERSVGRKLGGAMQIPLLPKAPSP
jgi:cobalt-zinc-cadmium efflux system outer membrane protein